MKKLTLLAINARYSHTSLAAWTLAEAVKRHGIDVTVAETNINQNISDIIDAAVYGAPDIVGVSVYIWNVAFLRDVVVGIRLRLPGVTIIAGGPEASSNADYCLACGVDCVVQGEGEHALTELLDNFMRGVPLAPIIRGRPVNEPVYPGEEYSRTLSKRLAYIETSRGCPFSCSFCMSGTETLRFFPLEQAKEQLVCLAMSGAKTIKFVDRTFNADKARAYKLFEFVMDIRFEGNIFHFEVAPDLFDERTIALLNNAPSGRIQLEAGLQSFNPKTLAAVGRAADTAKACSNLQKLIEPGNIHVHVDLIVGLPFLTLPLLSEDFNIAYNLKPHNLQLGFLKMLHGSRIREEYGKVFEFSQTAPYQVISTPWLSRGDMETLKIVEDALSHTYNKKRFLSSIGYVISAAGVEPFGFYYALGKAVPHGGEPLCVYAEGLFNFLSAFQGVCVDLLIEHMILDWLKMVKGNDMPPFLKIEDKAAKRKLFEKAREMLGQQVRRNETALLPGGLGAYADANKRNPVTGLYDVCVIELD